MTEEVAEGNLRDHISDYHKSLNHASGVCLHAPFRENARWNKNQHQVSFNASLPAVSVASDLYHQVFFAELDSEIAFCPKLT